MIQGIPIVPFLGQLSSVENASLAGDLISGSVRMAQQTTTGESTLSTRAVSPPSSGTSGLESSSTGSGNAKSVILNSCYSLSGSCGPFKYGQS